MLSASLLAKALTPPPTLSPEWPTLNAQECRQPRCCRGRRRSGHGCFAIVQAHQNNLAPLLATSLIMRHGAYTLNLFQLYSGISSLSGFGSDIFLSRVHIVVYTSKSQSANPRSRFAPISLFHLDFPGSTPQVPRRPGVFDKKASTDPHHSAEHR